MSFTTPPQHGPAGLGFTNATTKLRAEWLNYVGGNFSKALDAIGGGYYQFTSDIRLSCDTAQVKINAPAAADPIALLGYVTIGVSDDANYAVGVGTLTVSSAATFSAAATFTNTVSITGAMTFTNTVQLNGAVTLNAALTCTTNGDITLQSGCAVTGQSGSSLTMDNGSTVTLGSTVAIATATRTYNRAKVSLQYVNITYWFQDPLYVRSYPAIMSQLIAGAVAFQVDNVVWQADIPDAATLDTVSWTISPTVAARGGLPTMPKFWVEVVNVSTGAISQSTNVTDATATVLDYEAEHTITSPSLGWVIDRDVEMVLIRVQGEAGANFQAGMLAYAPICVFTRAKLAEE